jgi:hypothetical protein
MVGFYLKRIVGKREQTRLSTLTFATLVAQLPHFAAVDDDDDDDDDSDDDGGGGDFCFLFGH